MEFLKKNVKGILLCLCIAIPWLHTGTTFSNYRRTGIRYSCRDDPDIIYQRQICFPERDYFCIKENITVCCHPSWVRAEPDCYSGNREAITRSL